jgi:VWFA-related protein
VKRTPYFVLLVIVAGALAVVAQTTDTEQSTGPRPIGGLAFVDELEVTVVNVIAYVTDKKGAAVTDLTRDDFEIYQDGQEREISNFQLFTEEVYRQQRGRLELGMPPPSEPSDTTEPPQAAPEQVPESLELQPSYMAIYIDSENLRPLDRNRVLNQLQSFVRSNCQPPVEMMVVSYNRSLKVLEPFTSDSTAVLAALRETYRYTGGRPNFDRQRDEIHEAIARYKEHPDSGGPDDLQRALGQLHGYVNEEVNNLQFTLGALRELITMLSGLPGKKSILYISNGLPMVPGIDIYYALADAYDQHSMITETTRYSQHRQFESLVANANAQNVTFYTIDAGGLQVVSGSSAEYSTSRDTMAASIGHSNYMDTIMYMADATGGVSIVNTNDIRTRIDRVEQDFYTYYSLGYTLHMSGSDKVHNVKVEIPGHPDYTVRYRRRFVEKSLESRVQDRVVTGLMFEIDENPMQIRCETGSPAPASADRWTVPFEVSFPIENVALMPEGDDYVGRVVMFVAARDKEGRQSDVVRQLHEVRIPAADYDQARRSRYAITASLLMQEGSHRVAIGMLDQVTRQASYQTFSATVGS